MYSCRQGQHQSNCNQEQETGWTNVSRILWLLWHLYIIYVRPHLEYASSLWDPSTHYLIETVQRFACEVIMKQWNIDYHVSLSTLDLPQLSVRWKVAKLSLFYKIVSGAAVFPSDYYVQVPCNYNLRAHSSLHTSLCRTNYLLFSFSPHCVSLWNNVPVSIRTAWSISSFKRLLLQYLITNSIGPC